MAEDNLPLPVRRGGVRRDPLLGLLLKEEEAPLPGRSAAADAPTTAVVALATADESDKAVEAGVGECVAGTLVNGAAAAGISGDAGAIGEAAPPPNNVVERAEAGEEEDACTDTDVIEPGVLGALLADWSSWDDVESRGGDEVDAESAATGGRARYSSSARHKRSTGTLFYRRFNTARSRREGGIALR